MMLLLLLLVLAVESRVTTLTVTNDDRHNIYLQTFGFENLGHIELTFNSFQLNPVPTNDGGDIDVGMVILDASAYKNIRIANDVCLLKQSGITQKDIKPPTYEAWSGHHYNYTVKTSGLFHVFFSHCQDGSTVSFEVSSC
jgi:hypothetical protein